MVFWRSRPGSASVSLFERNMKINSRYKIRHVADEDILLVQGRNPGDMTTVIAFNESSLFLWNSLKEKEFDISDVVALLMQRYDVDRETACKDAETWIDKLKENNIVA